MKKVNSYTKRVLAMLLSGLFAVGSVSGTVLASEIQEDMGQTSEYAAEELGDLSLEEVSLEDNNENSDAQEKAISSYTVTLDANGGCFANEWDDSIGDYVEQAEVVARQIPVGGTVTAVPVSMDQDGRTMLFAGWSLERDGELVSTGEYVPVESCSLYAVWQENEISNKPEEDAWVDAVEIVDESTVPMDTTQDPEVVEEGEDAVPEEKNVDEGTDSNSFIVPETEEELGIIPNQEDVFSNENEEETNMDSFDAIVAEEEADYTSIDSIDSEEEVISEDALKGIVDSGTCGENLIWELDEEGTLIISGEGEMDDYNPFKAPWGDTIEKLIINDGVTRIGKSAFGYCESLNSVTIPDSVTSIGSLAFEYCTSLTNIMIPNKVKHIANYAFEGCKNLTNVSIAVGVTSIGEGVFSNCYNLSDIIIPSSITNIGPYAFSSCSSLVNITIPSSVTYIGDSAFQSCRNLTSVELPDTITSIESSTFSGCNSLTSVELPDTITRIERCTFSGCSSLSSIIIPDSVTSIKDSAFSRCTSLTSIAIPERVTEINADTFYGCTNLRSVFIPFTVERIDQSNFLYYNERTGEEEAVPGLTISGYSGTEAQRYADQYNIPFDSLSIPISGASITVPDQIYSGNYHEPKVTVNLNGTQLTEYTDYTVTFRNNINAGTATVTITGKYKYEGTEEAVFTIEKASQPLSANNIFLGYPYSEEIYVYGNEGSLTYESSNSEVATVDSSGIVTAKGVGTATITIKASETDNYKLTTKTITVTVPKWDQPFIATDLYLTYPNSGKITVFDNEGALTYKSSNIDVATVDSYGRVTAKGAGAAKITITAAATSNCNETTKQIIVIVSKGTQSITTSNMSLTFPNTGKVIASGNKGTLSYKSSNTAVATVDPTGKVTTKGAGTAKITITAAETDNYNVATKIITVTVAKAAQSITAKAAASSVAVGKTTTISITGNKGSKSFKSSDTTIATVDKSTGKVTAKKVGTVKITATTAATANYNAASKTVTIKVVPAATASLTAANQATDIKLTWKKVTGANGYKVYRGSTLIKTITSGNTVTFADTKANTNGTKYTYKVVAKAATGDSTLSKSVAVYRVTRATVSSVTNSAASKMTVKWGKNVKATGYQIQYSTDKSFKTGNKAVTVAGASAVSKVIGSLAKSKTYYVRIRTYKTVGSAKYWSVWSAAKSVKISK